ncbi:MAG: AIM24 family protein [Thermoleophilia bacterium]
MQSDLEQFSETTSTEAFALQNHKLLKVRLDQVTIQAKLGSMVAYQGEVSFEHAGGGGLGRLVKKVATGEGQSLMKIAGRGEVFLADTAQDIHLFYLQDDRITVNGRNVLAFDDGIDWDIERVKSVAGMVGGGLFNTRLQGTGWVAVLTDGPPVRLDVSQAPTFADAQAAVAWSSGVTTTIKTDIKLKSLVGLGSGETFQIAFSGEGWVLVQPSEGRIMLTDRSGG